MWGWVDWFTGGGGLLTPVFDSPLWFCIYVMIVFRVFFIIRDYKRSG